MGFAAASESSYMDEGDGLFWIGVQVAVEFDDSVFRGVSGTGIGRDIDEGQDTIKPVLHVGDQVLGMGDRGWVPMGFKEGEVVAGNLEGFHGANQGVGSLDRFRREAPDESGA